MDFADIILCSLYLVILLALASALWSYCRMKCRRAGHGAIQNGIRVDVLSGCVWVGVVAIVICARLFSDGTAVDTILVSLLALFAAAVLTVVWAMIKRR
ncbi:MAG: hypothetical protein LUC22_03785 [Prevotella sp.]|nr:hypothetical protein [Prevotella sp.]